jgi:heterodisulfide reductase subunit C
LKGEGLLAQEIIKDIGENVYKCYQCVKCTSGCPTVYAMDLSINQIMRALQLGKDDLAIRSKTIWLCTSCWTCATRCPQGIDITSVMDFLRMKASKMKIKDQQAATIAGFNQIFLDSINSHGRIFELGMIIRLKIMTRKIFQDLGLGLRMILKGKIPFVPQRVGKMREVRSMFDRIREIEKRKT